MLRSREPRILNLDPPPHLKGTLQQQNLEFLVAAEPTSISSDIPARRTSKRASPATNWPPACRRRPRKPSTSRNESKATHQLYGIDEDATREYGTRCLIARRLVERGVRFVQLFLAGQPWDNHTNIRDNLPGICRMTDKPAAALVKDLKSRGMLDTTDRALGGRDRPVARHREQRRSETRRPRSQRPGLQHLAGRRRHSRRHDRTARPTNSATRRPSIPSARTTIRPRCCSCSASTTSATGVLSQQPGADHHRQSHLPRCGRAAGLKHSGGQAHFSASAPLRRTALERPKNEPVPDLCGGMRSAAAI